MTNETKIFLKRPFGNLLRYLAIFQSYVGKRMYYSFALMMVAVLSEGFGIVMLLPLLQSLNQTGGQPPAPSDNSLGHLAESLRSAMSYVGLGDSIAAALFTIALAFALKGLIVFSALRYNAMLRSELLFSLKKRLFDYYSKMNYHYYVTRDTGYFVNLINEQVGRVLQSFFYLTQMCAQFINAFVYLVLAFLVAWRFGLMALIVGFVLLFLFRWLNDYVTSLSRQSSRENGHLAKLIIQTLHAFKYLTSTNQIEAISGMVTSSIRRLQDYEKRTGIAASVTLAAREPIAVVLISIILFVQLVYLEQPLAPILVSILLFYRGMNATLAVQGYWQGTLEYIGSVELLDDEFRSQEENQEIQGTRKIGMLDQGIKLENVSFSYDSGSTMILSDVSLEVPARSTIAIAGVSGAGKSTIVDILTLMLKPQHGSVSVDGVPANEIELASWRNQIGYVSQDTVVFDDTITNNICLWCGIPEEDPDLMERIKTAARQAKLLDFIETMPEGLSTMVGDRGIRLSGGQKQRLFIARELFRRPSLLILDEATSALDTESEQVIQQSVESLKGQITVVMITHRLSTIRDADYVYLIDNGKLVESGSYKALRNNEASRLNKMIRLQNS